MNLCEVAVKCPFNNSILTYSLGELSDVIKVGMLVEVPLGKRTVLGCIVKIGISENDFSEISLDKIKSIIGIYDEHVELSAEEIALYRWISGYYHYSVGLHIFETLPKKMKRPKELGFRQGKGNDFAFKLNQDQQNVVDKIGDKLNDGFSKWLIHGVTGSGKSAIYFSLMKEVLKKGQSVLFLLPEINLTPQFIEMLTEYMNAPIFSYNSSISNSDKYGLWKLLQTDSSPKVIIGVRSSVYLPIKNLGLIVVDEEHDSSFKQEDRCPYNARDIAIKRGSLERFPVVLGSATPAVETYHQFNSSKTLSENYFAIRERIGDSILPSMELIDMRKVNPKKKATDDESIWPFHQKSLDAIKDSLEKKEQVLVFVNRLGFSTYIQCRACGHQFHCPNCSVNLKYFNRRNDLSCQHCDYVDRSPEICPECGNMNLYHKGYGTEKLQQVLSKEFPTSSVGRFDRDEIKNFKQLKAKLDSFHSGEIDILVGTQMLSKGHNFKNVNLVLILGVDSQLNFPDFHSNERVYQLLTQVGGRSGRFGKKSRVLIHTMGVENGIFEYVLNHSFDGFYNDEVEIRKICSCPPIKRMIMVYFSSKFQDRVINEASRAVDMCDHLRKKHFNDVEILGPRPAVVERKVNRFTWSIMLRSSNINQLHNMLNGLKNNLKSHYSIALKYDVDPYHLY